MERFHNFMWIYGSSLKTGKGVYTRPTVGWSRVAQVPYGHAFWSQTSCNPLRRCLTRALKSWDLLVPGVDCGGWEWANSPGSRGERGQNPRMPCSGWEEPEGDQEGPAGGSPAQRGEEGWRVLCWADPHTMSLPLTVDQVSPMSPSKPTLLYWRTRCPSRRVKPSRSFISSWTAGGSSGRRAPLPPAAPASAGLGQGLFGLRADLVWSWLCDTG